MDNNENKGKRQHIATRKSAARRNFSDEEIRQHEMRRESWEPRREGDADRRSFENNSDRKKPFDRDRRFNDRPRRDDGENRPFDRDRKPFDRDRKPFDRDRKFNDRPRRDDGENRPFDRDRKPFDRDRKPFDRDRKFGDRPRRDDGENRPFDRDRKPFDKDRKFGDRPRRDDGENRPFDRDRKPFDRDRKPFDRDRKFGDRPRRDDGENRPFDRDRKPFDRDRKFGDRPRRDDGENRPFDRDRKPFDRDRKFGDRPRRDDGENRPFDKDRKFGDRKPFDKDRKFGDRPRRDDGENRPFDRDRKPFDRDRKPFDKDRKFGDRPRRDDGEGSNEGFERSGRRGYQREKDERYDRPSAIGDIRLNKFLADSGICSRREADDLITAGCVTVNDVVVTELGTKVKPSDKVVYGGNTLSREKLCYVLLNKPKGVITTSDDPYERHTVMDLVEGACSERIYPVGRLDRNTLGLLLLTNDGDLAKTLTHPSHEVKKLYHVTLNKPLTKNDLTKISEGLELEDGPIEVDAISWVEEDPTKREVGIEIHSGRNHIVRRIFESLGYEVVKLDRVTFAGLTKYLLPRGHWRFLTPAEISMLKRIQ